MTQSELLLWLRVYGEVREEINDAIEAQSSN